MLDLSELANLLDGRLHGEDHAFAGVSTDTRTLQRGDLFVALRGPNFDGHRYLHVARERRAAGALVARDVAGELPTVLSKLSGRYDPSEARGLASWVPRSKATRPAPKMTVVPVRCSAC